LAIPKKRDPTEQSASVSSVQAVPGALRSHIVVNTAEATDGKYQSFPLILTMSNWNHNSPRPTWHQAVTLVTIASCLLSGSNRRCFTTRDPCQSVVTAE
jgi:hypothetical protein